MACFDPAKANLTFNFKSTLDYSIKSNKFSIEIRNNNTNEVLFSIYNNETYSGQNGGPNVYSTNLAAQPSFASFGTDGLVAAERWETIFNDYKDNAGSSIIEDISRDGLVVIITFKDVAITPVVCGFSPIIKGDTEDDPLLNGDNENYLEFFNTFNTSLLCSNTPYVSCCNSIDCEPVCNDITHTRIIFKSFPEGFRNSLDTIEYKFFNVNSTSKTLRLTFDPTLDIVTDGALVSAINDNNFIAEEVTTILGYDDDIIPVNLEVTAAIINNDIQVSILDTDYRYANAEVTTTGTFHDFHQPEASVFLYSKTTYNCNQANDTSLTPPVNPPIIPTPDPTDYTELTFDVSWVDVGAGFNFNFYDFCHNGAQRTVTPWVFVRRENTTMDDFRLYIKDTVEAFNRWPVILKDYTFRVYIPSFLFDCSNELKICTLKPEDTFKIGINNMTINCNTPPELINYICDVPDGKIRITFTLVAVPKNTGFRIIDVTDIQNPVPLTDVIFRHFNMRFKDYLKYVEEYLTSFNSNELVVTRDGKHYKVDLPVATYTSGFKFLIVPYPQGEPITPLVEILYNGCVLECNIE